MSQSRSSLSTPILWPKWLSGVGTAAVAGANSRKHSGISLVVISINGCRRHAQGVTVTTPLPSWNDTVVPKGFDNFATRVTIFSASSELAGRGRPRIVRLCL